MYTLDESEMHTTIETAQQMEEQIVKLVIADLLAAGMTLTVDDGESCTVKQSTDADVIFAALRTTDEDSLIVRKDGEYIGRVMFAYGNDGYDVICDNSTSLDPYLKNAEDLAARLEDDQYSR